MYQLILCTCPDQESAQTIAKTLVTKKRAACVNIIPNMTSVYEWEGELVQDSEVQLLIKSQTHLFTQICEDIVYIHPYETPEIIAIDIAQGNPDYMNWINKATNKI